MVSVGVVVEVEDLEEVEEVAELEEVEALVVVEEAEAEAEVWCHCLYYHWHNQHLIVNTF